MLNASNNNRKPLWHPFKKYEVHCESPRKKESFVKRADPDNLKKVFTKYATIEKDGEKFMTLKDFVVNYLGLLPNENFNEDTVKIIGGVVDQMKNERISFKEFLAFEELLCSPEAMYYTAFQLFDQNGNGYINFDEFRNTLIHTTLHEHVPFKFSCDFIDLQFGKKKSRFINYTEFTQLIKPRSLLYMPLLMQLRARCCEGTDVTRLLAYFPLGKDYHEEHAVQAFQKFDHTQTGSISVTDFNQIMILLKSHLLTPYVRQNLAQVAQEGEVSRKISFSYFTAFISLLNEMELIKKIFLGRAHGNPKTLTRDEFMNEAQLYTQITPQEIDILFKLVEVSRRDGRIEYSDLVKIAPIHEEKMSYHMQARILQEKVETEAEGKGRTGIIAVLEQIYRFGLGSIAGAVGATAVYPIDLVKTRMQNQRSGSMVGELMYKNSLDCFKKVVRFEGLFGLYRGLAPQLVGVAPEKAIKLTMNDFVKDVLSSKDKEIPLWGEILAGGCAGASQVMFTNPLEIVKIRLQVAGEIAVDAKRISALTVVRDLGFLGLYKGSRACFLRDIPFSAIYFPSYNHIKQSFMDDTGYISPLKLLLSATMAGAPAAALATPADVIKTRLQVVARSGQTTYTGVIDATRKIWAEEGARAFWKGAPARVCRSSPQFGVTLLTYEMLQRLFYVDFGGRKLSGTGITQRPHETLPSNPDHIGGYKMALATFAGIESKFGICLPKFKVT